MKFDTNGGICGGSIINYLLEKSRVIYQSEGERNYHAFYQIIAGGKANPEVQEWVKTTDPQDYHYINTSGTIDIPGMNDEKEFDLVKRGYTTLGMDPETEQRPVCEIVSAVLHLGNIIFEVVQKSMEEDSSAVANMSVLELCASLLSIDAGELNKNLTSKNIGNRSVILVQYNLQQASEARDALVKAVYGNLFQYIIDRINKSLAENATSDTHANIIGVLDIFGFESFEKNSFEQLCINFCNEKLQFHFNEHIFKLEQEVYDAEGIIVPKTDFVDNKPTLDLIEAKGTGIFPMIDEEINVPRGSDKSLLSKLQNKHGKHPNFKQRPPGKLKVPNAQMCFGVEHYAGDVFYDITNFLEKNKDQLHADLKGMVQKSSSAFVAGLFAEKAPAADAKPAKGRSRGGSKKSASKTLGAQFKTSLNTLMVTLNAAEPHFVRCMKPNKAKVGGVLEADMMLGQLRYSGLLEVCRIRKLGYPVRRDNDEFFKRYKVVVGTAADLPALIAALAAEGVFKPEQYAMGKTKVFMRNLQATQLEAARDVAVAASIYKIQSLVRGAVYKFKFRRMMKAIADLNAALEARSEESLTTALDMFSELPYGGKHMQVYKDAQTMLVRLQEEGKLVSLLEKSVEARDKEGLKSAISTAEGMDPPFNPPIVVDAKALVERIEKEEAIIAGLKKAMAARDHDKIDDLLHEADELELDCDEVRQATALKARLEEEEETVNNLKAAIEERDLNKLSAFLSKCTEMGLTVPEVTEGKKLQAQLQEENAAKASLKDAVAKRELDAVSSAIVKAEAIGLTPSTPELAEALDMKIMLEKEKAAVAKLEAAISSRIVSELATALTEASELGLKAASTPAITDAEHVKDHVEQEEKCRGVLAEVAGGDNMEKLTDALKEASNLGLSGPEVDAAKDALKKLTNAAQGAGKLTAVASSDSVEEITAALEAADRLQLQNTPEYATCKARVAQLEAEIALIKELVEATSKDDNKDISRCVAECMKMGIMNKYPVEVKAAKDKANKLDEDAKVSLAISHAVKSKDLDALESALARAAELNYTGDNVTEAMEVKQSLQGNQSLNNALKAALASGNQDEIQAAYDAAVAGGLANDNIQQARVVLDRSQLVAETYAQIDTATNNKDLDVLQKALETAIQLGLSGDKIDAATAIRETLQGVLDAISKVKATTTVLQQQMTSAGGIKSSDVELLGTVLKSAEGALTQDQMSAEIKSSLADAKKCLENASSQIKIQEELHAAKADGKSHDKLKSALAAAREIDGMTHLYVYNEVVDLFKVADQEFQKARELDDAPPPPAEEEEEVDDEAVQAKLRERQERAKHSKFHFRLYPGLRTPDDFAKTVILQKRKLKEGMLNWSNNLIPKSLIELPSDDSKMAIQIHKSLLGYMGDKVMSFPATLAESILTTGHENIKLRDEIYMQIMKQLTKNPTADSIAKGWQVMCMCVSCFPPSSDFEDYLLNFMLMQREKKGAVKNYARYCLRSLEGILTSGGSNYIPTVEEIQAYKERPPILATVELVDGNIVVEELPVTPDLNVQKVVEICSGFLELTDERRETMGIFVYDLPRDGNLPDPDAEKPFASLERTPRPLRNEDFMGDIIVQKARQKRNYKFVYKRKIFLPSQNTKSNDEVYNRLIYLQAEDEVILTGNLPIQDAVSAGKLAALSYRVNLAEDMEFPTDAAELLTDDEDSNIVGYIPMSWREEKTPEEWAEIVVAQADIGQNAVEDCQQDFIEMIWDHELYGGHFFNVIVMTSKGIGFDLPSDLKIAFSHSGMTLLDMDLEICKHFGFADIYRWGGSSSQFSLIIWNAVEESTFELKVSTAQAADMAGIILDYISAIMNKQGDGR
uniref:Uncharacterized protein n=2 Tax=Octactis speculum TaxID=3111310 RepID=A0A7S2FEI0_9STRA